MKSIVCLLHSVLKIHKQDKLMCRHTVTSPGKEHSIRELGTSRQEGRNTPQNILQTGLHLLHLMLQHSAGFLDRHLAVQHKYVELICSLSHIFRSMENNENECKYYSSFLKTKECQSHQNFCTKGIKISMPPLP